MSKEIALIYNPSAGGGKALRRKRRVELSLQERGIQYDLFVTESESHLVETAREVVQNYPFVIGAGGDTTINIIATQILKAGKNNKLGIISLGSINDLARELDVHRLEDACDAIQRGSVEKIDVGVVSSRKDGKAYYFLVSASLGLGVAVNRYVDIWMRKHPFFSSFRSATQSTAAMSGILKAYKDKQVPLELKLEFGGKLQPVVSPLMVFCNAASFGGSFRPSPYASLGSGKLDCCIFNAHSMVHLFKVSIDVKRQKHLEKENVSVLRNELFKLYSEGPLEFQVDGEIIELTGEAEITLLPRALSVVANPLRLN